MGGIYVFKTGLLQQLVPVAHFHVSTSVLIVEIDGMIIDVAVPSELIGQAVVASMDITEENNFGFIVKGYRESIPEYIVEPAVSIHFIPLLCFIHKGLIV
jgi:hypothetical protein